MTLIPLAESEQMKLWNGHAGHAWVEGQELLDGMFQPFEQLLAERISPGDEAQVLDVGCGTGGVTLALQRRLAAAGECVGIDISGPMIAAARARAAGEGARARFIQADAQSHAFAPGTFHTIVSRFGVMFFDDPVVAFANLRRAAKEKASLRLIAWRSAEENRFMTAAERAAAPFLPDMPPRRPDAPGQFALANWRRTYRLLEESGWADIEIQPVDIVCTFPAAQLVRYLTQLGPVGVALKSADAAARTRVLEAVQPAFDPYIDGAEVRFTAACWLIDARN